MLLLSRLLRAYLLRQLLGAGRRRQRRSPWQRPYGRRGRGGLLPFPHYSTRTRGGGRVTIGGCCLPLAVAFVVGACALSAAAARFLAARARP
jgi:hypothetical protein